VGFKEWLKQIEELTTTTADIANYARPLFTATNFNMYPDPIVLADPNEEKRKNGRKVREERR
jgi:hypothetical protein